MAATITAGYLRCGGAVLTESSELLDDDHGDCWLAMRWWWSRLGSMLRARGSLQDLHVADGHDYC